MFTKKNISLAIVICVAIAIFIQALQTYQAISVFGKADEAIFNRSMQILALNFLILAISVIVFYFNKLAGLSIACASSIFAASCIYIVSGNISYINGWFTIVPLAGLVVAITINILAKKNA